MASIPLVQFHRRAAHVRSEQVVKTQVDFSDFFLAVGISSHYLSSEFAHHLSIGSFVTKTRAVFVGILNNVVSSKYFKIYSRLMRIH